MKELIQAAAEKYYGNRHDHTSYREYERHVTHYLSLLKADGYEVVKVDKWISVEDRLPVGVKAFNSYSDTVLVYGNSEITTGNYCHDRKQWFNATFNNIVTHWQPLPSPPKTDKP